MKNPSTFSTTRGISRALRSLGAATPLLFNAAPAAIITWDGGGSDGNFSTAANWSTDVAPAATGDTLVFAGVTNLSAVNDSVTALATSGTAITFASGAGSFHVSGNTLTLGSGGGGGQVIVQQNSASNQVISANINLSGGNGDRSIVFASGAGSLTLSGNINFSNDWLFPTTTAGTIILSGNNSGDGKGTNAITAGTNVMRAMMRNNVAGTNLVLGSDTALGNSGSGDASAGTASLRGIIANQQLNIGTTGGDRNLSGSTLAINTSNITFNGANNLAIGNLISQGGNRDFVVSSTGAVTVSNGLFLSADQTGRNLYLNLSGAGGMTVNGTIRDTFHSGGITTGQGTLRKAGTGTLALNGNSSYTALTTIEAGTLKLGHANALGATGTGSGTTLTGNATLDLNGISTGETITLNNAGNKIVNSSVTAGGITADASLNADFTFDGAGDISVARLVGSATRTVTKLGNGTLTSAGGGHNNLVAWNIQAGTVVFSNSSGFAADRGVALHGGTLRLSGGNADLINNSEAFTMNGGIFDLNGKNEAVASIGGSGGTIRNGAASTTSTLYVGGGPGGSSSASFAGVIEDGASVMKLTKEGSGTQTLSGTHTYTGETRINGGSLALASSGSIESSSSIVLAGGNFNVSAVSGFEIGAEQSLTGNGSVTGDITVAGILGIGASPGTMVFNDDLVLAGGSLSIFELTSASFTTGTHDLAQGTGNGQVVTFGGSLILIFDPGEGWLAGSSVRIFDFDGYDGDFDSVTFSGLGSGLTAGFDSSTGFVNIAAVPEPAAAFTGGIGLLLLLGSRRRCLS